MVIGMLLAKMAGKEYVGFIDADNYVPGAVNEYAKIFASGIAMSQTPYVMTRISWIHKPKISETGFYLTSWGADPEEQTRRRNSLLHSKSGVEPNESPR